jgi:serine phosphatase RsbU (regulator of sigma subunit)/pSer/pThr/pTyr-binding forkhead associated (FHA) protein
MASLVVQEDAKRTSYDLQDGQNVIGRHPNCRISIVQASVSGKHAIITGENGQFFLDDVGSRNGTFVNKQKVAARVKLNHNDMIQFGDAMSKFDDPSAVPATPSPAAAPSPKSSATLDVQSAGTITGDLVSVTLNDDTEADNNIVGEVKSDGRFSALDVNPEAKLKAVLEITNSLAGTVDLDTILPKILDTLFEIFRYADRGCILLRDNASAEMVPRAMKHRREGEDASVRLSRTIVKKVLDHKIGVMSADAAMDSEFSASESIVDLKIRSMMCVPLLGLDGESIGVLSIDSQNPLGQFTQDDLDILMTIAGQAALSYENARLMKIYSEKLKTDGELDIARSIQKSLLPAEMPDVEGYQFFASYDAAQAVGGDYYDWFDLGNGRICISFGDIAGKGVPGAIIMGRMNSCVQSTIRHVKEVIPAIKAINDHMCDTNVEGRFVTYVLAIIDTKKHTVELANAGHMAPIIRRANGSVEQFDEDFIGTPVGVLEDYPYESEIRTLEPGDMVVIFTDGVDEAMNYKDELYGGERLLQFVKDGTPEARVLGESLLADVRKHADGRPQNDDITIMTFGRNPE